MKIIKKIRVSEETLTRVVLFVLMIVVTSLTYYAAYCSEYVYHNDNPFLNGLSFVMFLLSTFFVVLWCMSLL